jgi:PKD repeat protein
MRDRIGMSFGVRVGARHRERSRGQSFVELALALPVFLLVVLIGLDFGRAFMGYVTLQQSTRIAANFASVNPSGWGSPGSPLTQQRYQALVTQDAQGINCDMPNPIPDPSFPNGTGVGMPAVVELTCQFHILTPIISAILPNPLPMSAMSSFPIRVGITGHVPGPGGAPANAAFSTNPINPSGVSPLYIQFIDISQNQPTSWSWDFDDNGSIDSTDEFPSHTYTNSGTTTITTRAWLTACNPGGCGVASALITVYSATPAPGACFTSNPSYNTFPAGTAPQPVTFDSTCSTGTPTSWSWDFNNDAVVDSTAQKPSYTYASGGTQSCAPASGTNCWIVTLTATNAYGSSTISHAIAIDAGSGCAGAVPNFVGDTVRTGSQSTEGTIQAKWTNAGYTGPILYNPSGLLTTGGHRVTSQSPLAGTHPACSVSLTLNWS